MAKSIPILRRSFGNRTGRINQIPHHHRLFSMSRPRTANYYQHLGISPDAGKDEIKSQFYKLSKLHHPDRTPSKESHAKFLEINEAYSVLGNDQLRREY